MGTLKLLTALDLFAFNWCLHLPKAPELARISRQVSRIGDGDLYLIVALLLVVLDKEGGLAFLLTGLSAYLIELPLYAILKNTIKRDRPCTTLPFDAYIVPSDKFSFPSGHSAAAFVFATLIASFYPGFAVLAYILAVMVGVSRVLLGVHYPTDIVAGAALGVSCTLLVLNYMQSLTVL